MIHSGWKESLVASMYPLWKALPKSRNGVFSNKIRQFARFSEGRKLSSKDRYWTWAGYANKDETLTMLHPELRINMWLKEFVPRRKQILQHIPDYESINDILYTDMKLVLPNDMLTKVDLMSMANGLEVRVPFLDYTLVDFVFGLPERFKINNRIRKRILQDSFRDILPRSLYNRPKKGFEVPLLKWFRGEMKSLITNDLLSEEFIVHQGVFDYTEIAKLKKQLFSSNPGDIHARIWGLIVFQWWWKKYMKQS
jgi:asparagine synthase (glutamine-hydrolysing)